MSGFDTNKKTMVWEESLLDFSFSDVQESMAKVVRNFAFKVLLPKYGYWDQKEEFPQADV